MNGKKGKLLIASALTALAIFGVSFSLIKLPSVTSLKTKADNTYSLTLDDGVDVTSDYAEVTNSRGTTFEMKFSYYTAGSGSLGTLATYGEILNYTAMNSIQSIAITTSSTGDLDVFYGWRQYESSDIEYASSASKNITTAGTTTISFSSINPSYFKLVANSTISISSITITYTCSEATTVPNLRITIAKPTVGGSSSTTINDDNYVWICTNVEDSSTWTNYVMTRNSDGTWYCDFSDVAVATGGYTYTLVVCDSNTTIDWTYIADDGEAVGFGIGAGQTEWNIDTVYNFAGQPTVASSTYTLSLSIYTSGTPSSFGNIQFIYNYTNSTSSYTWNNYISTSWSTSYDYSISGLDTSQTLYFKLYMWSDSKSIYVGSGSSNFQLSPTGSATESASITFTYSTSSPITGTCTVDSQTSSGNMYFANQTTTVYGDKITIAPTFSGSTETFTASYSGENIRIDDNLYITGLKAGTSTTVTLTSYSGLTCTFTVKVSSSTYSANRDANWCGGSQAISTTEGWFTSTTVSEISGMGSDFYNGVDISSAKALYDNGSAFYNSDGVEQSLFYILKDAGVNWARLKLWVDPESTNGISYGGGESNLENTLWMAYEAKAAGLNLLLDFHYSDFWTHPGQQILPKSWTSCTSKTKLCSQIKSYTTEALTSFKNADCLPDMVQLGNEISSGIYLKQYTGSSESLDAYGQPSYLTSASSYSYGTSTWSNYSDYIKAGYEGVNAVDSSIKKVLHWAKGSTISASTINSFFSSMPSSYYDYAAISFYPYYCFDTLSDAQTILNGLSLSKPWFVAEMSYPFSGAGYVYEDNTSVTNLTISDWNVGDTDIKESYDFDATGQANLIHDITAAVVSAGGKGIFYWEPAWIPNVEVGWAGEGSGCTWSNQGFFSFDGKAIANLDLFAQMSPYI